MSPADRMSGLDAAYISAELPGNALHLMAILTLDPSSMPGGYSFQKLRAFMEERLPEIPPLRRKLAEVPFGIARPRWIEVQEIDLDLHVRHVALPSPGTAEQLSAMAAQLSERPLDRRLPLWEIAVVEGLESGEIALIAKLHHAMMDGMVGVKYMAKLLGDEEGPEAPATTKPEEDAAHEDAKRGESPSDLQLFAEALPEVALRPLRLARATSRALASVASSYLESVFSAEPDTEEEQAEQPPEVVIPHTLFNKRSSARRDIAHFKVPMPQIRAVGRAFGATVNDVVLAMVGSAARNYLAERDALPEESLGAAIPASTHRKGGDDLANAYTLLFPTLATDIEDPGERLRAIIETSRSAKSAARPVAGKDLMSEWVDIPPPWFYNLLARAYVDFHFVERMASPFFNLLVSSVPGPDMPLTFAGARITGIHPLGPIYDGMLLNITAIGRGESVDLGLVACHEGVPGVWEIVRGMEQALDTLLRAAGVAEEEPDEAQIKEAAASN